MTQDASNIKRGLEGVVVDSSAVSEAFPEKQLLIYRGYPVHDLAVNYSFEEVAYLLWYGELPSKTELEAFSKLERENRQISSEFFRILKHFPQNAHPMDALRTAVSFLGMCDADAKNIEISAVQEKSIKLLAQIPIIVAAIARHRRGLEPIAPNKTLSISENFFIMTFGAVPHQQIVKAFDGSLVLYAEHGFNASTFAARVITSSLSDIYSAVTGAICSLKGPLHGGANEAVMWMLKEIEDPARAKDWLLSALKEKRKIMGFGHRLYRSGDSRVPTMKQFRNQVATLQGAEKWIKISNILEETMILEKKIYPNLDFPAAPTYYAMGLEIEMYTPLFVMARITGWTAHIIEQLRDNRLIRPLSHYVGKCERPTPRT